MEDAAKVRRRKRMNADGECNAVVHRTWKRKQEVRRLQFCAVLLFVVVPCSNNIAMLTYSCVLFVRVCVYSEYNNTINVH